MKFSIIMPVYNSSQTLKQAAESILQQDYTDFELILVNDGSQDNSNEICLELQVNDNRVKYMELPHNTGVSQARNQGIQAATGDYVGFVDADDTLESNTLSVCHDRLELQTADILVFGLFEGYFTASGKQPLYVTTLPGEHFSRGNDEISLAVIDLLRTSTFCYVCNKLYRRSLLIDGKITFPICSYGEDIMMNLDAFAQCSSVLSVNLPLYHYDKTIKSSATKKYEANFLKWHQHLMDKEVTYFSGYNYLEQALPVLTAQYLKLIFTALQMVFFKEAPSNVWVTLLQNIFNYPHHKLFISHINCLPLKYRALGCVLKSHSAGVIYITSYLIYITKHKLVRLWYAMK